MSIWHSVATTNGSWTHSRRFWWRSSREEAEESADEEENNETETTSNLRLSLGSEYGIDLSELNKLEDLLADEPNRIILEDGLNITGFLGFGLRLSLLGLRLDFLLDLKSLLGELLSVFGRVADVQVVKQDVLCHSPEFNTNTTLYNVMSEGRRLKNEAPYNPLEALDRGVILEVSGVGDLSGGPLSLVFGIVDHRGVPLALEGGVGLQGLLPFTAPSSVGTLGVRNGRSDPVTILLVIPFLGFLGVGVGDRQRFVIEPALGLDGILINDLIRSIFIPIGGLCRSLGQT